MTRTQTPQILCLIIAIALMLAYSLSGFTVTAYICLAFVALFLGAALMLDYDEWLEHQKEMQKDQEAIRLLVKTEEDMILKKMHLMDACERAL